MFVLPAMKSLPHDSHFSHRGLSAVPKGEENLCMPTLPPTLPSSWGIPFFSILPEEGAARTELVGEYLLGLAHFVQLHNNSLTEIFNTAIESVIRDEKVEREFILEDADLMALKCFIDYTSGEALAHVERREERGRLRIIDCFFSSASMLMCHFEMIHRKHVATQFLESLFLKLCQVKPGWMWRRVPCLLDEEGAVSLTTSFVPSWVAALAAEESFCRGRIIENFFHDLCLALDIAAAGEKRILFETQRLGPDDTVRSKMERNATIIQAAFRGFHARLRSEASVC